MSRAVEPPGASGSLPNARSRPTVDDSSDGGLEYLRDRFRNGDERGTELSAHAALSRGIALLDIYDVLRTEIHQAASPDASRPFLERAQRAILTDRLVRLVTRLQNVDTGGSPCKALVLDEAHGTAAAVAHLLSTFGFNALLLPAAVLSDGRLILELHAWLPAVEDVVIDCTGATDHGVSSAARLLTRLARDPKPQLALLLDPGARVAPEALSQLREVSVTEDLRALMSALKVPITNPLTPRERDVLQQVSLGATNEQVAKALGLSLASTKTYLERAQAKLHARDRTSAVATALRRGWL